MIVIMRMRMRMILIMRMRMRIITQFYSALSARFKSAAYNYETAINASAAVTLLEQRPEKINDRYHSVATMAQITFIFTVLGPSLNVPI